MCTCFVHPKKKVQSVGRMYVRYYNRNYRRSETLWEGCFKSSLVQNELYLLELYRYIELNPVRVGMVEEPSAYSWSSYSINVLGIKSDLQTPHPEYLALGQTKDERLRENRGQPTFYAKINVICPYYSRMLEP